MTKQDHIGEVNEMVCNSEARVDWESQAMKIGDDVGCNMDCDLWKFACRRIAKALSEAFEKGRRSNG